MSRPNYPDTSFSSQALSALRQAKIIALCRRLLVICPPAAGVANRVAACVGTELTRPGEQAPLLVAEWAAGTKRLRDAEQTYGTNDPNYLVIAIEVLLAPLAAALALAVSVAGMDSWRPDEALEWDAWRDIHIGELIIERTDPSDYEQRRIELERQMLGPLFTQKIRATKGWPNIENRG